MAVQKQIEIVVDTDKAQKPVDDLNKSLKKTDDEVKNVSNSSKETSNALNKMSGGAITKFKGFKKSVGGVISSMKTLRGAIIATGIGALLIAVTSLIAAFRSSEEGQNKFAKLMGVIGSVVGNLVDLLADLGEALIDAISNPRKAWDSFVNTLQKGYNFIKGQIVDRFKASWTLLSSGVEAGILKMRIAWNKFTGDSEEADQLTQKLQEVQEEAEKAAEVIEKKNQEIIDGYNKAKKAVQEFTDEIIREAGIAAQIADKRAKADKINRNLIVERAKANRDIAKFREISSRRDLFTLDQRKKALVEASRINEDITNKEIAAAKLLRDAKIAENKLTKSTKEDLQEEEQLKAKVIELETARLNLQRRLGTELASISNQQKAEAEAAIKKEQDELKREEEKQKKKIEQEVKQEEERLTKLQEVADRFRIMREDLEDQTELEKLERQKERDLLELERVKATEEEKLQARLDIQKIYAQKEQDLKDKAKLQEEKRDQLVADAKVNMAQNVSNLIGQIVGKDSAVAKGVAVASATISGIEGVQNAFTTASKSPVTTVFPAYPYVQAGLAGAFSALQIREILKTDPTGRSVSSPRSTSQGQSAPAFNLVQGTETSQITDAINQQNQQPTQAYVLSSEVETQAALDRQIETRASFG